VLYTCSLLAVVSRCATGFGSGITPGLVSILRRQRICGVSGRQRWKLLLAADAPERFRLVEFCIPGIPTPGTMPRYNVDSMRSKNHDGSLRLRGPIFWLSAFINLRFLSIFMASISQIQIPAKPVWKITFDRPLSPPSNTLPWRQNQGMGYAVPILKLSDL
jgi:hypothetical protein